MFLQSLLSIALVISSTTFASPTGRDVNFKQGVDFKSSVAKKLDAAPIGWVQTDNVAIDKNVESIKLRIHLVQQDVDKFHTLATNIATPGHELYGKHLDQSVIDAMIAPKTESRDLVMQWLDTHGLGAQAEVSPRLDTVVVKGTISQAEKLLSAEYAAFENTKSGATVIRTLQYSLPDVLKSHVDMIQPTTFFGLQALKSTVSIIPFEEEVDLLDSQAIQAVTGCTGTRITPACLANLYSFTGATAQTVGRLGIAGFLGEQPSKTDLSTFLKSYGVQGNSAQTYTCTVVNGGSCPTSGTGFEANLDVQYARAISESIPNVFYSTGGSGPWLGTGANTNEPYLEFLNYMLALPTASLPNTLSISYGDDEYTVPDDYAFNACNLFSQLGARGVSILVSSGDSGVGDTCKSKGNSGTIGFTTSFPASCPWVTVVGGTTGNSPEAAWSGSGGGFSNIFGRPSYQDTVVKKWLATDTTHTANAKYFNASGRAYPDISAESTNFAIVLRGSTTAVSGTSCSAPTVAAIIQLLNSDRISKGKTGLGFLNPWLYSSATSGFTDIKTGKNTGCSGVISGAGFNAVTGWDPATGLGTPVYTTLLSISNAT